MVLIDCYIMTEGRYTSLEGMVNGCQSTRIAYLKTVDAASVLYFNENNEGGWWVYCKTGRNGALYVFLYCVRVLHSYMRLFRM